MAFFEKYELVEHDLILRIKNKEFYPKNILPSERKLAEQYSVNRSTIHKAIVSLKNKAIILQQKQNNYVIIPKINPNLSDLLGENKIDYFISKENIQILNANEFMRSALNIAPGEKIIEFLYIYNRLLNTKKVPISFNEVFIPLNNEQLLNLNINNLGPLYWFKKSNNSVLDKERLSVKIVYPSKIIRNFLNLTKNDKVVERISIFTFKDKIQRVRLVSFTNPKFAIINAPVKEIRQKIK